MDKTEFRNVYMQYHGLVSQIAYNVIGDYHLAQDITQDIFAELYQKWETIDVCKIKGWLITCTTRKAIDYKRKSYYEREVSGGENMKELCKSDSTEYEIILRENYGTILSELCQKNKQWFEVIIRLDVKGEKPKDVAKDMGITLNNLRVKHHRAKEWLSHRFSQE
jgi:RNA polymerase sigma-70 factor (ECF subfamily)